MHQKPDYEALYAQQAKKYALAQKKKNRAKKKKTFYGSCANLCNQKAPLLSGGHCFCDSACAQQGDCCDDYYHKCVVAPPAASSPPMLLGKVAKLAKPSCQNNCQGFVLKQDLVCFCDSLCELSNDCCPGKQRYCPSSEAAASSAG